MPDEDPAEMARFVMRGRQIEDVLQSIEDALIAGGYDDFMVATKLGTFH